jgi:hypothetical protein
VIGVDALYVAARRILLDVLEALGPHRPKFVLVGAQAVYLQAGDADMEVVAPYTKDADLGIDARDLDRDPSILGLMTAAGFSLKITRAGGVEPGTWVAETDVDGKQTLVPVDLLVPEALAYGNGRRDARLPNHGKNATRRVAGLEATVRDNVEMTITSLEIERDPRTMSIRVAGPAALLVAKAHKLGERLGRGNEGRIRAKDAGDVVRLMRGSATPDAVGKTLAKLAGDEMCGPSVRAGVDYLERLFATPRARGVDLAVKNVTGAIREDEVRALMPTYLAVLLAAYRR